LLKEVQSEKSSKATWLLNFKKILEEDSDLLHKLAQWFQFKKLRLFIMSSLKKLAETT
jgi:hypothetical protein